MPQTEIEIPDFIKDSSKLAEFMGEMTIAYDTNRWRYMSDLTYKPAFLVEALGGSLTTLPTFFRVEEERHEAQGLGKFLDAVHLEMRNLARNIGKKFAPELEKIGITEVPAPQCPFASKIKSLEDKNSAKAAFKVNNETLELNVEGPNIAKRAFSALAASRAILQRMGEEAEIIQDTTGSIYPAYVSVAELADDLVAAIKSQHPEYEHLSIVELGLDIAHKDLLTKKAKQTLPHARTAFNLFRCSTDYPLDNFADWVATKETKIDQVIYTSAPQDICAAFYGCVCAILEKSSAGIDTDYALQVTQDLEQAKSLKESAEILNAPRVKLILEELRKSTLIFRQFYVAGAVQNLNEFRDTELGVAKYPAQCPNDNKSK